MNRYLSLGLVVALLSVGRGEARPERWFAGAALGTAAGLIIANNVHGVNPWVAAPVGAVVGGYLFDHSERGHRGHPSHYRHGWDYPFEFGYHYGYVCPPVQTVVVAPPPPLVVAAPPPVQTPVQPTADLHPGVDLIKVSILNRNGIRTDVPILRINGKFVGPQGEEYATLPTSATLAARYGM
jgi:hypothetical protein